MKGFYPGQDEANEKALLSDKPAVACSARAAVSGWPEALQAWANAELQRPGCNPVDVLATMANLQVQTFACFLGPLVGGGQQGHSDRRGALRRHGSPPHGKPCEGRRRTAQAAQRSGGNSRALPQIG